MPSGTGLYYITLMPSAHKTVNVVLFCFSRAFSAFVDMFYNCSEMDTRTMCIAQTQNSLTIIYNNRILKK